MSNQNPGLTWSSFDSLSEARGALLDVEVEEEVSERLFDLVDKRSREYVSKHVDSSKEIDKEIVTETIKIGVAEHLVDLAQNDIIDDVNTRANELSRELEEDKELAFTSLSVIVGSKSHENQEMARLFTAIAGRNYTPK